MLKIIVTVLLLLCVVVARADDKIIGEAFNPCGEPHLLTTTNYENYGDGIIYNGHKYPGGFFFFYGDPADAEFHHDLWKQLKEVVADMAKEVDYNAKEKCEAMALKDAADKIRFGVDK